MNHTIDLESLEDPRALQREKKKRPRMRKRGFSLKKRTDRPIRHIHKKSSK